MDLARKSRGRLSVKDINAKYGWPDKQPALSPPENDRRPERTSYDVQASTDLGKTWTTKQTCAKPVDALRVARERSALVGQDLYRVLNVAEGVPMLHFRRGMAVYEERGWT